MSSSQSQETIKSEQMEMLISSAGLDTAKSILDAFWKSNDDILGDLQTHLSDGDLTAAAASAHALKGSAANLGATRLSERARVIETACKNADPSQAVAALENVGNDLRATKRAFDELILANAA